MCIRDRDKEMLAEGFTLKGKAYDIDFAAADDEIREIDVREQDGGLPKAVSYTHLDVYKRQPLDRVDPAVWKAQNQR